MQAEKLIPAASGSERAALLLLMLGEEKAAEVLRFVPSTEVEKIGTAMAQIREVNNQQAEAVIDNFQESLGTQTTLGVGVPGYVRQLLVSTLGEHKGRTLADKVLGDDTPVEIDSLRWLDMDTVVHMLRDEHPQIIAITLAHMSQDQAAYILDHLLPELQEDVVVRIATMDKIPQAALLELQDILKTKLSVSGVFKTRSVEGAKAAASIINCLGKSAEGRILGVLGKSDQKLCEKIQDLMFVFSNLGEVDNKGIQLLLREVSSDLITVALKGADEKVRSKFFSNMSKRAGEMLLEDMEARGPVKLSEVEAAQKEILAVARRLADEGQIMLGAAGDDYVS